MDQLNLEKKGIPTVTIATTAFEDGVKSSLNDQGVSSIALVPVEHPIAGHSLKEIREKAEKSYADILKAATQWQPTGR